MRRKQWTEEQDDDYGVIDPADDSPVANSRQIHTLQAAATAMMMQLTPSSDRDPTLMRLSYYGTMIAL